jgi:hypothetical protein
MLSSLPPGDFSLAKNVSSLTGTPSLNKYPKLNHPFSCLLLSQFIGRKEPPPKKFKKPANYIRLLPI